MIVVCITALVLVILLYWSSRTEHMVGSVKYSVRWKNRENIQGIVTKWILRVVTQDGIVIDTLENTDPANLQNFTDVNIPYVLQGDILNMAYGADITLDIYYNAVSVENKLHSMRLTVDQKDVDVTIENLSKLRIPVGQIYKQVEGMLAKKFVNFVNDEYIHTRSQRFTFYIYKDALSIFLTANHASGYIILIGNNNSPLNETREIQASDVKGVWMLYWIKSASETTGPFWYAVKDEPDRSYWISMFKSGTLDDPPPPAAPPAEPAPCDNFYGYNCPSSYCKVTWDRGDELCVPASAPAPPPPPPPPAPASSGTTGS